MKTQFQCAAVGDQECLAYGVCANSDRCVRAEPDAWECKECFGQGKIERYHKVTHQLGSDMLPFLDECEVCEGLGYLGPDAEIRAKQSQ